MSDNLLLDLTPSEVEVVRRALRLQVEAHKRNDFKHLEYQASELMSKISNALIELNKELTMVK